tara:strand:+ start:271 stop:522 length:252 start_codon:yes stop_codon:yes gene_type:complete
MDYLLLNEVEVRSVDLSEKQRELRRAVQRIIADEDASTVARELLEQKIVSGAEVIEMMVWIKNNRERFQVKPRFKSLNRRGRR